MGGLDMAKMKERRASVEARSTSGKTYEKFSWQDGWTLFALLPPTDAMEGAFWIDFSAHSNIGPNKNFHVCLEPESSPILTTPSFEAALDLWNEQKQRDGKDEKAIDLDEGCPDCKAVRADEGYEDIDICVEGQNSSAAKMKYILPIAVFGHYQERPQTTPVPQTDEDWEKVALHTAFAPKTVWEGVYDICEVEDVTNPDSVVLIWCKRWKNTTGGKGGRDKGKIEYKVDKDTNTLRKPIRYPKSFRLRLREAQADGGEIDPLRLVVAMTKPAYVMEAHLRGLDVDKADGKQSPAAVHGVPKRCFGVPGELNSEDAECQGCEYKVKCAKVLGLAVPPDLGSRPTTRAMESEKPALQQEESPRRPRGRPPKVREPEPPLEEMPEPEGNDDLPFEPEEVPPRPASRLAEARARREVETPAPAAESARESPPVERKPGGFLSRVRAKSQG